MLILATLVLSFTNGTAFVQTDAPCHCIAAVTRRQYDDITFYSQEGKYTPADGAWAIRVGVGTTPEKAQADIGSGLAVKDASGNWVVLKGGAKSDTPPRFTAVRAPTESSPAKVTVEADVSAGSTIELLGKTELDDAEWRPVDGLCRFFKAVQK